MKRKGGLGKEIKKTITLRRYHGKNYRAEEKKNKRKLKTKAEERMSGQEEWAFRSAVGESRHEG